MSTYSLEEFYLDQVNKTLKKSKYTSSTWERIQEKSSTWLCYVYNENEFIGKLTFTFRPDFNSSRLIPLMVDIDFDTLLKKTGDVVNWNESRINDHNRFSCTYDFNDENTLRIVCINILKLLNVIKPKSFWNLFGLISN